MTSMFFNWIWTDFTTFFSVFIVDFEQVNISWVVNYVNAYEHARESLQACTKLMLAKPSFELLQFLSKFRKMFSKLYDILL